MLLLYCTVVYCAVNIVGLNVVLDCAVLYCTVPFLGATAHSALQKEFPQGHSAGPTQSQHDALYSSSPYCSYCNVLCACCTVLDCTVQ